MYHDKPFAHFFIPLLHYYLVLKLQTVFKAGILPQLLMKLQEYFQLEKANGNSFCKNSSDSLKWWWGHKGSPLRWKHFLLIFNNTSSFYSQKHLLQINTATCMKITYMDVCSTESCYF